jgi:hypothetical protein
MWEMACNMPEASDVRLQINIYLKKKKNKKKERKDIRIQSVLKKPKG